MRKFDHEDIYFAACQHATFMEDIDKMRKSKAETVKHAHWIVIAPRDVNEEPDFACSSCFCISPTRGYTRYCPNCGARMDEERKEE